MGSARVVANGERMFGGQGLTTTAPVVTQMMRPERLVVQCGMVGLPSPCMPKVTQSIS
jgi:hypothetical protein